MARKIAPVWYVVFMVALASHFAYTFWLRDVLVFVISNSDHPLQAWLGYFYPGFKTKLAAGQIPQILQRADGFVWRIWLASGFSFVAFRWLPKLFVLSESATANTSNTSLLLKSWWWIQTFFAVDLLIDLVEKSAYSTFFQPLAPWRWLFSSFPSELTLYVMASLYLFGLLGLLLPGWQKRPEPAWVCWFIFLLLQVFQLSFGKLEHTYISFTFAGFWLVFNQQNPLPVYVWLARLSIGLCYFFAGLEKILIGGTDWWQKGALSNLIDQSSYFQMLLLQVNWFEPVLQTLVLVFQLSAPFLAISSRHFQWFAGLAICFHLSVFFFTGIGGLVSPWIAALLVFIAPAPTRRRPI